MKKYCDAQYDGWWIRGCSPETELACAASVWDATEVARLLARGAAVESKGERAGWTALHCALGREEFITYREAKVVRLLLSSGAKLDSRGQGNETPLHIAAHFAQSGVVDLLVRNGADVDAKTDQGDTPLHLVATRKEYYFVTKPLPGTAEWAGYSSDTSALREAKHRIMSTTTSLVNHGSNLVARNNHGYTPEDSARIDGCEEYVREYLELTLNHLKRR